MQESGKKNIRLRFATSLRLILKEKKDLQEKNKASFVEDIRLVDSLRKLEAESGLSYNIIQGVFSAKRDLHFTTFISILENLNISILQFAEIYESLTDEDILAERKIIESRKRIKNKKPD